MCEVEIGVVRQGRRLIDLVRNGFGVRVGVLQIGVGTGGRRMTLLFGLWFRASRGLPWWARG